MKIKFRFGISLLCFVFQSLFTLAQVPATVSGSGTTNFIPRWTGTTTLGNSGIFQSTAGNIGIGTTTPATKFDLHGGADIRGLLTLFPPTTGNVFGISGTTFAVDHTGHVHFVAGQTFPGTGTITGVAAGTGLSGGGSSGKVILGLNTAFTDGRYAQPGISNTFTADQFFNFDIFVPSLHASTDVDANGNVNALIGTIQGQVGSFGFSTVGGQSLFSVTGNGVQALQLQSFAPSATGNFMEAQFDTNGSATFFTDNVGNTTAIGTKSAAVALQDGQKVKVFSMESPEVWFEDFGTGQLRGGVAAVSIDPKFIQTVNVAAGYRVFVTPKGDCNGLFVANETDNGFEVRELKGGESNLDFDYRIVAHRSGYESTRLPAAVVPKATTSKVLSSQK